MHFLSGALPFGHLSGWVTCDRAHIVCARPRLPRASAATLAAHYAHDGPTLWFDVAARSGAPAAGTLAVMAFDVRPHAPEGAVARLELALLDAAARDGASYPAARAHNAEVVVVPEGTASPPLRGGARAAAPLRASAALARRARWLAGDASGVVELVVLEHGVPRRVWVAAGPSPE